MRDIWDDLWDSIQNRARKCESAGDTHSAIMILQTVIEGYRGTNPDIARKALKEAKRMAKKVGMNYVSPFKIQNTRRSRKPIILRRFHG